MARRRVTPITLSFLDAMTCGFGAVILFFMIINATVGLRAGDMTRDRRAEVDLLEIEVMDGHQDLVDVRNSLRNLEQQIVTAHGLSSRLIESLEEIQIELAVHEESTLARSEHMNRLKSDLKTLAEEAGRLSASTPSPEVPGDKFRAFVGDGDRQYLTGLKVGGKRILLLLDSSASMLADDLVNIIRFRNLPDHEKVRAAKWRQAVKTVDWLTTQFPQDSSFQIYSFAESAFPVVSGTGGSWLNAGSRQDLERAMTAVKSLVPGGGTNLYRGLEVIGRMKPRPDNLILLVDSLPTQGAAAVKGSTVDGKQRMKLFREAIRQLGIGIPVNVILFPMEGDPDAASAFWQLAIRTHGSFLAPTEDWP